MIASLAIALGTLRANPLRTVLSTLGIVIGAAALVAVLTLGDGMERFGRQQLASTTDLQSVVLEPRTAEIIDNQAYPIVDYLVLTRGDADRILGRIPQASAALLSLTGSAPLETPVHPIELLATIYHAVGINPNTIVYNHLNQPRELVKADPVTKLFG